MNHQRGIALMLLLYAGAALAIVGVISGGIWKIHHNGYEKGKAEIQAKWDQAVAEQRAKEQKATAAAETKLGASNAKAKVVYRTITKSVDKIVTRDVYVRQCLDDDGLRLSRAALLGESPAAPVADGGVPKPDSPR